MKSLLARKVRQGREKLSLTQRQFAVKARISRDTILRIESGDYPRSGSLSAETILALSITLKVTMDRVVEWLKESKGNGKGRGWRSGLPRRTAAD